MRTAYVENRFEYRGFPCVVLFQKMGHRCGYVGLPKENLYYKKDYEKINVLCHGGLTYASEKLPMQDDKDTWWIGFDCAHFFDRPDFNSARKYFADDKETMERIDRYEADCIRIGYGGEVRTQEYVENECRKIVDQLIEGDD